MRRGNDIAFAAIAARGSAEAPAPAPDGIFLPLVPAGALNDHDGLARATVEARLALEEVAVATAAAAARALSLAEALDEALNALAAAEEAGDPPRHECPRLDGLLSPREREVLALVAEGRSNKAIADELYVSPNTVKTHVASLMHKLHAESRAHLAAIAARHTLLTVWAATG